jgi:hypothetical protein
MQKLKRKPKPKPKPNARGKIARPGSAVGRIVAAMTKERRATSERLAKMTDIVPEKLDGRVKAANKDYLRPKGKAIRKNDAGEYVLVKS